MQKYRVIGHGQNLLTEVDGVRQRLGFYTNVFIEAFTSADAESRAIDLVREDSLAGHSSQCRGRPVEFVHRRGSRD